MYALLILDVQVGLLHGTERPWRADALLATLNQLMGQARAAKAPIFLAQHVGPVGSPIQPGSPLAALASELRLEGNERVFEKRRPNAFVMTDLAEHLRGAGATGIVIAGMKTQFCVDSTCRAGRDLGFDTVLIADGHTCSDTAQLRAEQIVAHHNATLAGTFANVVEAARWRFPSA